jgi:hypothetical protein
MLALYTNIVVYFVISGLDFAIFEADKGDDKTNHHRTRL